MDFLCTYVQTLQNVYKVSSVNHQGNASFLKKSTGGAIRSLKDLDEKTEIHIWIQQVAESVKTILLKSHYLLELNNISQFLFL
ncbi:hypothetical protein C0J52_15411 [Blattella germanica]|nr:hypothetical protein C0J52_15411 [Blattella germanica]